jgi:hypothetical protein
MAEINTNEINLNNVNEINLNNVNEINLNNILPTTKKISNEFREPLIRPISSFCKYAVILVVLIILTAIIFYSQIFDNVTSSAITQSTP